MKGILMATEFNIEERWPELFEQLTIDQRRAVINALASNWHEGWVPNREDVENLTDYVRGAIDRSEYDRRAQSAAVRNKTHAIAS
jgi:type III secretory pathway component EscV